MFCIQENIKNIIILNDSLYYNLIQSFKTYFSFRNEKDTGLKNIPIKRLKPYLSIPELIKQDSITGK